MKVYVFNCTFQNHFDDDFMRFVANSLKCIWINRQHCGEAVERNCQKMKKKINYLFIWDLNRKQFLRTLDITIN